MNKKFSTLLAAGLLATSSLCGSAWAQVTINGIDLKKATIPDGTTVKTWAKGPYFVVVDADNSGDASENDILLKVTYNETSKQLEYAGQTLTANDNKLDLSTISWYLHETSNTDPNDGKTYYYKLQNVGEETYLAFDDDGNPITDPAKSSHDKDKKQFAIFATADDSYANQFSSTNNTLNLYPKGSAATNAGLTIASTGVTLSASASALTLYTLDTQELAADEAAEAMNAEMAGEGFSFDFGVDNKYAWQNDNLSDVKLKAFYVDSKIDLENGMEIPAGVYFATDYPEELVGTNEITTGELFKQCTFLAIDPMVNYDINKADRGNGVGFELATVQGSEMNFFMGSNKNDNYSHAEEIYVGNACFTIEVPDAVTAPDEYNIKAKDIHVFVSAKDNAAQKHVAKSNLYIGCVTDQLKNYLVTTDLSGALAFTTTNSTLLDGDDLVEFLQEEDAPSVYTLQFVSGQKKKDEASEYKQYLTVYKPNTNFALASTVDFDEADPMYQFVVTDINKTNKTITLTNRQTKHSFTVSLYENKEDVYTVLPAASTDVYVEYVNSDEEDESVEFAKCELTNMQIVLTPYTVEDKFATFVNRADNMGLVQFELAVNNDAATAFYVGGTRDNDGKLDAGEELLGYVDSENMTQFELIKSEKPSLVLNKYIYLDGKRIKTSTERDTVAYYKYAIQAFDEEIDDLYLNVASSTYKLETKTANSAQKFIIKQNLDGSVALINANNVDDAMGAFAMVDENLVKDKQPAWVDAYNYQLENKINKGLKTFMVDETPAVSYEAVPQHVSFGLVRGGFLTNKDNDAFQSIATEASEDLTFWVDTVKSDQNIPSFYITKAGHFLYNAEDSVTYYEARGNYRFNLESTKGQPAKLIFKAGELVSSDTLRTVVDGKSVLVAEKDNAPKKIKGGLNKFQFQIIKAEDGSDEYVIRQGRTNYVQMINSYFYLSANKNTAVRFTIEKQSAPTANEGVAVSEVTVIAGEGQLTIANAAGKKVVVSNILGQVVANTVLTSDNAVIVAPQGVVVVAVEGEEAVKAIVK
ncbi:MAG: hypothetical protein J6K31_04020 [Parabacteroides sp.]|nr:hypothetical protein [Parabacteroides sp.]